MAKKKKEKTIGTCRLCLEVKKLCKAHIIPKPYFDNLRAAKGQPLHKVFVDKTYSGKDYQGYIDTEILCQECDRDIIGKWDSYAIEFFRGASNWQYVNPPASIKAFFLVQDYEFEPLKLFFISLVWRASISKHPFYENINLGTFEHKAHQLLTNSDAGGVDDFTVFIEVSEPLNTLEFGDVTPFLHRVMAQPSPVVLSGTLFFRFHLNEFTIYIKADNGSVQQDLHPLRLEQGKSIKIVSIPYKETIAYRSVVGCLMKQFGLNHCYIVPEDWYNYPL